MFVYYKFLNLDACCFAFNICILWQSRTVKENFLYHSKLYCIISTFKQFSTYKIILNTEILSVYSNPPPLSLEKNI